MPKQHTTILAVAFTSLLPAAPSYGQEALERELTVAAIDSRIAAVQASAQLEPAAKAEAKRQLEEAQGFVLQAEKARAQAAKFERLAAAAPAQLLSNRRELAEPVSDPKPQPPSDASRADLERLRAGAEADLKALREELDALRKESADRVAFLQSASERISNTSAQLTAAREALKGQTTSPELPEVASRLNGLARRAFLVQELRRLQARQASYMARRELLQTRIDLVGRRIRQSEKLVAAWQELEAERRQREIEEQERKGLHAAKSELVRKIPALQELSERRRQLSRERKELGPDLKSVRRSRAVIEKRLAALREQFAVTRRKVEAAGVTVGLGVVLRRQLAQLPTPRRLSGKPSKQRQAISSTQYRLILVEEERAQPSVADLDLGLRKLRALVTGQLSAAERAELERLAPELLKARREGLDELKADLEGMLQALVDLDLARRRLRSAVREYRSYLEEQILWVPSVSREAPVRLGGVVEGLGWLFRSPEWRPTWGQVLWGKSWRLAILLLALVLLLLARPRLRRGLTRSGEAAWRLPQASVQQTLRATVYTAMLAAPLPFLMWGLGMILSVGDAPTKLGVAFGAGLRDMGLTWFVLELLRQSQREGGLGQAHFRWASAATGQLSFHLAWLLPVMILTTPIATAFDTHDVPVWNESLGRLAFLISMLALAVFSGRVLRPGGALLAALRADSWTFRLRWIGYALAVGIPITFAVLALRGYYYTAQQLEGRLQWTLGLLLCLGYLDALVTRWLRLSKLRFAAQPTPAALAPVVVSEEPEESASDEDAAGQELAGLEAPPSDPSQAVSPAAEAVSPAPVPEAVGSAAEAVSPEAVSPAPAAEAVSPALAAEAVSPALAAETVTPAPAAETVTPAPAAETVSPAPAAEVAAPAVDLDLDFRADEGELAESRLQTQKLFRTVLQLALLVGVFVIWSNHLPALRRLERVQVWPTWGAVTPEGTHYPALEGSTLTRPVATPSPASTAGPKPTQPPLGLPAVPAPTPSAAPPAESEGFLTGPLSLAGLGLAIVLILFMVVAAKNLPGLVDIVLSQRSTLDAGTRFAASAVLRYLILAIGLGAALSTIGLRWGSVQWLVAALTFGLAFGLQEIFANFVSGLILLFERPIRIGDWVTIGDMNGIVTRIQIRATTVRDFDRKDHVIPNKTFVTGEIVNWALSDTVMRIKVPVGVAYGSNVPLVRETLLEIVKAAPEVLPKPAPKVHFLDFGDSALQFEIRAFVPHPNKRLKARNWIRDRIDVLFRERGITIAFPQRDLHLRSLPAGTQLVGPAGAAPSPEPAPETPPAPPEAPDGQA